jgi:dTMP kinase
MSIEGIDGAGKSTQVAAVAAALARSGVPAEPAVVKAYGARSVNALAEKLTGNRFAYHPLIPAELREWTFACDVAYYTRTEFTPRLDEGTTLIWDRGPLSYRISALAYGGLSEWVEHAQSLFPQPRTTYLLDLPTELAVARLRRRSSKPQQADESFALLRRVRELLLAAAGERPNVVLLDATRDAEELTGQIVEHWLATTGENLPATVDRGRPATADR